MANPFCLIPRHVDEFLAKVKSGEWSAPKLFNMSSEERHAVFAEHFGDANAERLNAEFESKLLLKNRQKALQSWLDNAGSKVTPEIKRDLQSRIERMDPRILDPKNRSAFLADFAKRKLGYKATANQAAKLTELSQDVTKAKAGNDITALLKAKSDFTEYTSKIEGGRGLTATNAIPALSRAMALMWPTVFPKLAAIAVGRGISAPIEDVVASGVSKLIKPAVEGGVEGGGRYGNTATLQVAKAEAAAWASLWHQGLRDTGRLLMNKPARLALSHGDAHIHAWHEYFGSLHAAIKQPIMQLEYGRSMYYRTLESIKRGEDPNDLTVQMRNSVESYQDAKRGISMQDNVLSKAFRSGVRGLESIDPATGKPSGAGLVISNALQTDMPVLRAPTNNVAEVTDYIAGLLKGPAKLAWNAAKGVDDLKPVERDMIIRQISKGSVGAALMLLYYFKHDKIQGGGFYQEGERRHPGSLQPDELKIYGLDIPKALQHHPLAQTLQFAATLGNTYGAVINKGEDPAGAMSAIGAGAVGLSDEVPIIGGLEKDFAKIHNRKTREDFVQSKIANLMTGGVLQWVAKQHDPNQGTVKPKGMLEHIKADVPILRESVPHKAKRR